MGALYGLSLFIACCLSPLLAHAATYHVAQSGGSDSNACGAAQNPGTAKATIGAGVGCLSGGDTLIIHAGIYPEFANGIIPSGSQGNPTTIKANGNAFLGTGERAILRPPGVGGFTSVMKITGHDIVIDGLVLDGSNNTNVVIGIDTTNGTLQNSEIMGMGPIPQDGNGAACVDLFAGQGGGFNTVLHNKIHDCQNSGDDPNGLSTHCIYMHSSNNVIDGNDIYNCGNHGIQQFNGSANGLSSNNNVIRNNRIHESGARAILLSSGSGNVAYNNIVYNNGFRKPGGGRGSLACTDGSNNQFYNNTSYGNAEAGLRAGPYGASGTVFRNNIVFHNGSDQVQTDGSNGTEDDHNLLGTDPKFVNAAGQDFHLQPSSPAIRAGTPVSVVTTDADGLPRGNPPQLGAFESAGASASLGTSAASAATPTITIPPAPLHFRVAMPMSTGMAQ